MCTAATAAATRTFNSTPLCKRKVKAKKDDDAHMGGCCGASATWMVEWKGIKNRTWLLPLPSQQKIENLSQSHNIILDVAQQC